MESWQIERIRSKVDEMEGELNVRIYTLDGTIYRIWYNPRDDVALYGRVAWDKQRGKEGMVKAWLNQIVQAVNAKGTRIFVQYRNEEKKSAWFGPERDMRPISAAYEFIMSFTKQEKDDLETLLRTTAKQESENTKGEVEKIF